MQVVDRDGFLKVRLSGASDGLTVGTTPIASGTIGRVLFEGTGNVLQQSANLFWDSTNNRLGIGTSTPGAFTLDVNGTSRVQDLLDVAGTNGRLIFRSPELSTRLNGVHWTNSTDTLSYGYLALSGATGEMRMFARTSYFPTFYSSNAERMRIPTTGNVLINTTTDAGFRLDVNGTARVQGQALISNGNNIVIQTPAAAETNHGINWQTTGGQIRGFVRINWSSGEFKIGGGGGGYFPTFYSQDTERMRISSAGNVLINTTTDAGFRLDVNGTARVSATDGLSAFQITAPTRAWYFTTSQQGGTFNAISGSANGVAGSGNYGFALSGGWAFSVGNTTSQGNSFFSVFPSGTNQGEVRIGGQTSNASSLVTMNSTTKGFLPPRMTTTQRNAIASPAAGLIVYDTTLNLPHFFNGTIWVSL